MVAAHTSRHYSFPTTHVENTTFYFRGTCRTSMSATNASTYETQSSNAWLYIYRILDSCANGVINRHSYIACSSCPQDQS